MTTHQERGCSRTDRVVIHCLFTATLVLLLVSGATGAATSMGFITPVASAEITPGGGGRVIHQVTASDASGYR